MPTIPPSPLRFWLFVALLGSAPFASYADDGDVPSPAPTLSDIPKISLPDAPGMPDFKVAPKLEIPEYVPATPSFWSENCKAELFRIRTTLPSQFLNTALPPPKDPAQARAWRILEEAQREAFAQP